MKDPLNNMVPDGVNYPSRQEVFAELKKRPGYEKLVNFSYTPGTGKSATLDEIVDSITRANESVDAFQALSELDRVKYYLAHSLQALHKILHEKGGLSLEEWINADARGREVSSQFGGLQCIADMALVTVPTQYRTTEVTI